MVATMNNCIGCNDKRLHCLQLSVHSLVTTMCTYVQLQLKLIALAETTKTLIIVTTKYFNIAWLQQRTYTLVTAKNDLIGYYKERNITLVTINTITMITTKNDYSCYNTELLHWLQQKEILQLLQQITIIALHGYKRTLTLVTTSSSCSLGTVTSFCCIIICPSF